MAKRGGLENTPLIPGVGGPHKIRHPLKTQAKTLNGADKRLGRQDDVTIRLATIFQGVVFVMAQPRILSFVFSQPPAGEVSWTGIREK